MKKGKPVAVRLDSYQISQIDKIADKRGTSRSEVARQLVDNGLVEGNNIVKIDLDDETYKKITAIAKQCGLDVGMTIGGMVEYLVSQTFMSYLRN